MPYPVPKYIDMCSVAPTHHHMSSLMWTHRGHTVDVRRSGRFAVMPTYVEMTPTACFGQSTMAVAPLLTDVKVSISRLTRFGWWSLDGVFRSHFGSNRRLLVLRRHGVIRSL